MPFSYGNYQYSVDKIKLKGKLKKEAKVSFPHRNKIRTWCEEFLPSWCECLKANYDDYRPFHYRYSFSIRVKGDSEGVFYVAEWYNGEYKEQREKPEAFLIEYNPNKSGARIYQDFVYNFIFVLTDIVSCDLAYDIPDGDISDVLIDTKCDIMSYGKTYNRTLYVAPKEDGSGRVKVYQKDTERKANGEDLGKTLRIEVSLKGSFLSYDDIDISYAKTNEHLQKAVDHLNSVKVKASVASTDDWKVFALSRLSPEDLQKCLGMMTDKTRSNYKRRITEDTYYTLDIDILTLARHIVKALEPWRVRVNVR